MSNSRPHRPQCMRVPNSVIGWVQAKRGIQHRIEVLDAADRLEHRPDVIQHREMAIEVGPNVIEETIRIRGPSLDHGMVRGVRGFSCSSVQGSAAGQGQMRSSTRTTGIGVVQDPRPHPGPHLEAWPAPVRDPSPPVGRRRGGWLR